MKQQKVCKVIYCAGLAVLLSACNFLDQIYNYPKVLEGSSFPLSEKWSQKLVGQIEALSVTDSDLILAKTRSSLYVLDNKGEILWSFNLGSQLDPMPAIEKNGIVFVADDANLWALDIETGDLIWKQELPEVGGWVTDASNDVVLVNLRAYDLRAYDAVTGSFLWSLPVQRGHVHGFVDDSTVYIPDENIRAVDHLDGDLLWEERTGLLYRSTDFQNGRIFYSKNSVYDVDSGLQVISFDTKNRIEFSITKLPWFIPESIVVDDDILIVTSIKDLYILSSKNNETIWHENLNSPVNPSILGDKLFIKEPFNQIIHAYDIETGEKLGELNLGLLKIAITDKVDMISTKNYLIFSLGNTLYAFGD